MIVKKPRVKSKEKRIEEIQAAARELFFKKGYQNSTIDEIADKAMVSKGTVYLYFKNKEDLYVSLVFPLIEKLGYELEALEIRVAKKDYKSCNELIMDLYRIYSKLYKDEPDGLRIFQSFQLESVFSEMSGDTYKKLLNDGKQNFRIFRKIISKGVESFLIKKLDPIKLTDAFWGLFLGIIQLEEAKLRFTEKNHILDTLKFSFSLISRSISSNRKIK